MPLLMHVRMCIHFWYCATLFAFTTHSENFFSILWVYDISGMMCGSVNVSDWRFFQESSSEIRLSQKYEGLQILFRCGEMGFQGILKYFQSYQSCISKFKCLCYEAVDNFLTLVCLIPVSQFPGVSAQDSQSTGQRI